MDTIELTIVGHKINAVFEALEAPLAQITRAEVEAFEQHIERMHTTAPIFSPTAYIRGGANLLDRAKRRVEILKMLIPAPPKGPTGMDKDEGRCAD